MLCPRGDLKSDDIRVAEQLVSISLS